MNRNHKSPNIVLIVMDTAAAKHMSLYGYPRQTTPYLEGIGEDCTVYKRCFAPACWTVPSHASMFTGLYPSQHGTHEANLMLSENIQHIVPVLKMAGYRTYGISQNLLVSPTTGLCRDFDYLKLFAKPLGFGRFHHLFNPEDQATAGGILNDITKVLSTKERIKVVMRYFRDTRNIGKGMKDFSRIIKYQMMRYLDPNPYQKSSKYAYTTVNLFNNILKDINSSNNSPPYFFFINLMETHEKYRPPLKWRRFSHWYDYQMHRMHSLYEPNFSNKSKLQGIYQNLYDDEIVFLDYIISRLWNICQQYPGFDNTVFIITSDHGEHFGEKGLYGHIISLYNELIWVPLLVKYPPGWVAKGMKDDLVSLTDLYATLLDLGNIPFPCPQTSISLVKGHPRNLVISQMMTAAKFWDPQLKAIEASYRSGGQEFQYPTVAIMTAAGKKIIEKHDGSLEVYDLNKDMNEIKNLAGELTVTQLENLRDMIAFVKDDTGYFDAVKQLEASFSRGTSNCQPFLEME